MVYNTIYDLFTEGLPTPTNNWIGLASSQYTALLKQTTGLAYFSNGMANFGWSIGQQTFNGLGSTAGSGGAWFPTPAFASLGAGGWSFAHSGVGAAAAHTASAIKVGGLSVPSSWGGAPGSPGAVSAGATKLVSANLVNGLGGEAKGMNGALGGVPLAGSRGAQRAGNLGVRYGFRYSVLARPPSAG